MADGAGGTVLVVDDDKLVRRLLGRALDKGGFDVDEESDGEGAVDYLTSPKAGRVGVVLMDFEMRRMGGIEATAAIRRVNEDVPIVGITGDTSDAPRERALKAGMLEVLSKPVKSKQLLEVVARVLADRPARRSAVRKDARK
uniref:Response regulatory domain-containing protein n=1 Tax=Bicosoecida sp. CB-2014 TaxID=1486930 RepID=A0A7S1CKF5_9STRA|mmetsp:Transcript_27538/g.95218  ORF Transcript_27538/g.95218 Transcript_27538/m.95218 type:complete len:142 (+) Transcript_27538:192-617(+)